MAGERDDFDLGRVAALARLRLTAGDVSRFEPQLATILGYVRQLRDVDTEDVPPHAQDLRPPNGARLDEVGPSLAPGDALANAPDALADPPLVRVPKVMD